MDLLTVKDAAAELAISPTAVRKAKERGQLTAAHTAYGRLLFWRTEVERYKAQVSRPRKGRAA